MTCQQRKVDWLQKPPRLHKVRELGERGGIGNHVSDMLQGLEVYSTVLWHMKKEVEVSYLAQEAIAQDRRSPHAWAIMGNCFSLQKVKSALYHGLIGNHE